MFDSIIKLGPIQKIYEALSAIADKRIIMYDDHAEVKSSNFKKTYIVTWNNNTYSSNDSASYWQGYIGYPIIAVLMYQGLIKTDEIIANSLKDVNWNELNKQYKRDYDKVINEVLKDKDNKDEIIREIDNINEQLKKIDITIKRSSLRPPK